MVDVRREASRIYRAALSGEMAVGDVRSLAAVLKIIGGLIADGEIEERVCLLEQQSERGAHV